MIETVGIGGVKFQFNAFVFNQPSRRPRNVSHSLLADSGLPNTASFIARARGKPMIAAGYHNGSEYVLATEAAP
jgi:hypothetical protein